MFNQFIGEVGEKFYVVAHGKCGVKIKERNEAGEATGKEVVVGEIVEGEYFVSYILLHSLHTRFI